MNVHLFSETAFTDPYIEFINNNFGANHHLFLIYNGAEGFKLKQRINVIEIYKENNMWRKINKFLYNSDRIIIHGLFNRNIIMLLFLQPWLLKKCYWVMWGGDLYYYKNRKRTYKSNIYEFIRRFVIRNMGGLVTHIKGDYELAKEWYGAKGKYYYSFMYPSNLYKEYNIINKKADDEKIYIQIGNSADPSNNHIEVLEQLKLHKDKNIQIICPLSYGNPVHKEEVIKKGYDIFGDKFVHLTEFMPFDEYLDLLSKIDIAIFNHKRQQAMGNITTLLGLGKKVYIRNDITTWQFCIDHDLKVFPTNEGLEDIFDMLEDKDRERNIRNVKEQFSEGKLKKDLEKIFG